MKSKITLLVALLVCLIQAAFAQTSGSITVGGDFDKFYPVTWEDNGWHSNAETQLEIGRSSVHENSLWRGSMMAKFNYHTTRWGNGSRFLNAVINTYVVNFIAGWRDGTSSNGDNTIIIWLRGGGTSYFYKSSYNSTAIVYDGSQRGLPYQEVNGPAHTYKTDVDSYVNTSGLSNEGSAYFTAGSPNYFAGNVGIGIYNPTEKLSVNGTIRAKEVKVEAAPWPDYVFNASYQLPDLKATKQFINEHKHLPEIPSAAEVEKSGINLGEMNAKLLKKIEELTLYLIEIRQELDEVKEQRCKSEK